MRAVFEDSRPRRSSFRCGLGVDGDRLPVLAGWV